MSTVERNPYTRVLFAPKFLSGTLNSYIEGHEVSKIITLVYGMLLERWGNLTKYLKSELEAHNGKGLRLLWFISSSCIEEIGSIEKIKLGKFLSSQFEHLLRIY